MIELLDLNEDCLINLCRYFDAESIVAIAETCTRLKNVASDFFKHKKSYSLVIGSVEQEVMAAKTLRKVGKFLCRIDLMYELENSGSSYNELFAMLTESVGENLIELSILGKICRMPLITLAPLLLRLQTLTLQNLCWDEGCSTEIDLPSLCPNLRKLTVSGEIMFAPRYRQSLPSLECLDADFASEQRPLDFFYQNTQLKKLNLRYRRTIKKIYLSAFNMYLVNLQELQLDVNLIASPVDRLPGLAGFRDLRALRLYAIPVSTFNAILKILETLTRLTDVVLQTHLTRIDAQFSSVQESLIGIATQLTELQSFATVNIDWTSDTVIDFLRQAKKLISLDFWSGSDSNYIVTPAFIRELASIRKLSVHERMQPLHLKMHLMDRDLKEVKTPPTVNVLAFLNVDFPFLVLIAGRQGARCCELYQIVEINDDHGKGYFCIQR